ncbi:vascular cell adhesion protein 1 [Odontesthes bonariensis]|uniref:vascular cell adhesion protein 1 n=1 Tax=Odontesthes bonariensis TaxID=219752 RepID=UPI003F5841D9
MLPFRMLGLLILTLLFCGAHSTCPSELNTLLLHPPVIIEEYGSEVFINCSSANEKISLWVGDEVLKNLTERDLIQHRISLTEWNMTAECRIQLNDSHECINTFDITVYKNPKVILSITPGHTQGEETQYELKCDVIDAAPAQNLNVTWYKNDQIFATNVSTETSRAPVNESFTQRFSISKGEKNARFRCEAKLDFGTVKQLIPVVSQEHSVSALYAPELTANHTNEIRVHRGENVTLACEVKGNPPPVFSWTFDGKNMSENTNKLEIIQSNHSAIYICAAINELGNIIVEMNVLVAEEPENATAAAPPTVPTQDCTPNLTPSEAVVRFGEPVEINCAAVTDVIGIGWEVSVGGIGFQQHLTNLTWKVKKLEEWTAQPLCYVTLKNGSQCFAGPNITLYKIPDIVTVSAVDHGPMIEGREYRLRCDIKNVAPAQLQVKWYKGNETLFTEDIKLPSVTPLNVSSHFNITPKRNDNGSVIRCEAELQLGPKGPALHPAASAPYIANVHYKPLFKACPDRYTATEGKSTLQEFPCEIDGNPPTSINWYHNGKNISSYEPLKRKDSGNYMAEIVNIIGKSSTSVSITIEYGPTFSCEGEYEVEENGKFRNPCEPEGVPPPRITWFKHEKSIFLQHWTKEDSGEYSLNATNLHGTAIHKFNLTVLYAPEFTDGNTTVAFIQGGNMTLNCSAVGNPSPGINWEYQPYTNLKNSTVGRYKIITVTGATSNNAGVYKCVATNKVGTVTRSVTLVKKDKASDPPNYLWLIIPLVFVFLFLLVLLSHFYKKKQGHYSFVANQDPSDMPLTAKSGTVHA